MEELEYISEKFKKDYLNLIEEIKYIKSKKKIPPHIVEFEGTKIYLYDEIVKYIIRRKNFDRTWWERKVKKVVYDVSNTIVDVKLLLGLDGLSNIIVYRRVNRGINRIRVVFIGSYMVLRDATGRIETSNATELDYLKVLE